MPAPRLPSFLAGVSCLLLAASACKRTGEPPRPKNAEKIVEVTGTPVVVSAPAALPPAPSAPLPLLRPHALAVGLRFTLVPNLPGVDAEDIPSLSHRRVEVLACDRRRLKLRWTGRVRLERPESARRREEWVKGRAHGGPEVVALPELAADYDEKEVSGTLDFPDFGSARALALPGLWPEGRATLKNTAAIWITKDARREIVAKGEAHVPFASPSPFLNDPAASLLARAASLAGTRARSDPSAPSPERLRVTGYPERAALRVDGRDGEVQVFRATNWFGTFEVLADEANPLVLSVLPDPPSSTLLDLFAPAKVLKTLLGYRVSAIDAPGAP